MKNNCFRHFLTVLLLLCTSAVVAHDFEVDRIYYSITGLATPTVEVSGYSQGNSVDIPETVVYEGVEYSVTRIGTSAFSGCSALTQITIPGSVKSIGESAFRGSSITSITIPEGVVEIARATFENCTGLTSISIPNSVTSVSYSSFSNTAWYNNHPDGVVYAGKVLYRYKGEMPNGTEVVIREGTVSIADKAFRYFDELVSVEIPYGVKYIGEEAFSNCSALREIGIPGSVEDMGYRAFAASNLLKVVIGDGVKRIGQSAFESCRVLSEIEIPNSVISIGDNAFVGTEWYENKPNGLVYAGKVLFEYKGDMPGGSEIVIEDGTQAIADGAFWYCDKLTKITIPNTVINIGKEAFCGCSGLVSVDIPNSVRSIGIRAFQGCNWLEEMLIGSSVASIGDSAFSGCSNLASITIPKSVTAIGKDAFKNCSKLGAIDIEDVSAWCNIDFGCYSANPLYYGKELRLDGVPVTEIAIPEGLSKINDYAFYNSKTIRNVKIPNSVTSIGDSAFFGSTALAEVEIPVSVKGIGKDAFRNCTRLEKVNISDLLAWCDINFGNSYSNPLSHAKNFCLNGSSVTSLVLPSSIAVIKDFAFYGCSSIKNVIVPENITYICEDAFSGCNSIDIVINFSSLEITKGNWGNGCIAANADVVIDVSDGTVVGDFVFCTVDGVNTLAAYLGNATEIVLPEDYNGENYCIGEYVFKDCTGLTRITIPDSVTSIGNYAFYGCTGLTEVILGQNVSSIGKEAFNNCDNIKRVINFSAFFDNAYGTLYSYFNSYPAIVNAPNGEVVGDFVFSTVDGVNTLAGYLGSATEIILPEDYNGEEYGIGESVFSGRADLTSITIHGNLTSIGKSAFNNCTALTRVNISDLTAWCNVSFGDSYANPLYYAKNLYLNGEPVTELVIPDGVTEIKSYAFYNCESITSITVPYSVTNIGTNAFQGCKNLKDVLNFSSLVFTKGNSYIGGYISYYADNVVNAPNGVVIGDFIFSTVDGVNTLAAYLGNATEIVLPDNYNGEGYGIGESVFSGRADLTSITLPACITSIGDAAFYNCSALARIDFPESLASIGENAFYSCSRLTTLEISNNVTAIGYGAFSGCSALEVVKIDCTTVEGWFENNASIKELVIGENVAHIAGKAFSNCSGIVRVTIGKNVSQIGDKAFSSCHSLEGVYITDLSAWCNISFGGYSANPLSYAGHLYLNGKHVTDLVIPDGVTEIKNYAFYDCGSLRSVTVPGTVVCIGTGAFSSCEYLATVINFSGLIFTAYSSDHGEIANNASVVVNAVNGEVVGDFVFGKVNDVNTLLKYIGNDADVTLPEDYNGENYCIGADAFAGKQIVNIVIPRCVTAIKKGSFGHSPGSLKGVYITDLSAWCNIDFESKYANPLYYAMNLYLNGELVTELIIPDGVTEIKNYAFYNCGGVKSIVIPSCVEKVGAETFESDSYYHYYNTSLINLSNLVFSSDLNEEGSIRFRSRAIVNAPNGAIIGNNVFCTKEEVNTLVAHIVKNPVVILPDSYNGENYCIGESAFYQVEDSLRSITIPDGVIGIGAEAFRNSFELADVTLGKNVSYIGTDAFDGCSSLKNVHITDLSAWCNIDFGDASANPLYWADSLYLNGELVTDLVIPDGVTEIKDYAFSGYQGLENVAIHNSVTAIGTHAFYNCLIKGVYITDLAAWCSIDFGDASANPLYNNAKNEKKLLYLNGEPVTDLVIPDGVTEIKDYAFFGNNGVNSVVIPKSVAKIGELAFYCYNLSTVINLSQLVFTKGSYEEHGAIAYDADVVKNIPNAEIDGDFVFYALDGDIYFAVYLGDETEIVLPDGFQGKEYIIDELALVLSPDVESVTIPTSVIGIRNNAFGNCDMLKNLYMMNELPPRALRSTFSDTHFESVTVYVPVGALETYRTANVWSEFWNIKEFDSTGIVEVENEDAGVTKTVYDLNGRVVENPSNGIYIINGKKVFVK